MDVAAAYRRLKWRAFRVSEGERILRQRYATVFGRPLDSDDPQTFTAKLYCRMIDLNRRAHPHLTLLADKYRVRPFVERALGTQFLAKLLWHGTDPAAIPFDGLPDRYVIKPNHWSAGNVVVDGDCDRAAAIVKLSGLLRQNFYWIAAEYHYYHIVPHLVVEEFLDDGEPEGPLDYRFWCFDGRPYMIQVTDRHSTVRVYYSPQWQWLDISVNGARNDLVVRKPDNLDAMLDIASKLSAGLDFVRVDLYNIHGRIVFGEMTFTPHAGHFQFVPDYWDLQIGRQWVMAP